MEQSKYPAGLDTWIVGYVSGSLTACEEVSLKEWRDKSEDHEQLFQKLISETNYKAEINKMSVYSDEKGWKQVQRKTVRKRMMRRVRWISSIAAVLVIGWGGYLIWISKTAGVELAKNGGPYQGVRLSRSSGEVFSLDTLHQLTLENILIEGNARQMIVKSHLKEGQQVAEINMIEVPGGAEYSLVLADGTKVLLNAGTAFRFPDNFNGLASREVYLSGEAYFEVTSDSTQPFIVHTDQAYIKVLGTSFNVMAYPGSELQQTTLVKGRVLMGKEKTGDEVDLLPGMQASFHISNGSLVANEVDVAYYTAWKDGVFAFREQRLEEVMETLSRWYGFEYFFQNSEARDYIYTGKVERHKELKEVLENFRLTEEIDFKINKNTIVIKTKN